MPVAVHRLLHERIGPIAPGPLEILLRSFRAPLPSNTLASTSNRFAF